MFEKTDPKNQWYEVEPPDRQIKNYDWISGYPQATCI